MCDFTPSIHYLHQPTAGSEGGARHSRKARIPLAIGAGDGEGRRRSRGVRYRTHRAVTASNIVYVFLYEGTCIAHYPERNFKMAVCNLLDINDVYISRKLIDIGDGEGDQGVRQLSGPDRHGSIIE